MTPRYQQHNNNGKIQNKSQMPARAVQKNDGYSQTRHYDMVTWSGDNDDTHTLQYTARQQCTTRHSLLLQLN